MSSSVPLAVCGRSPDIARAVCKLLDPEYDGTVLLPTVFILSALWLMPGQVVHVCLTHESALEELPAILRGNLVTPSSAIGTNAERDASERFGPRAVVLGGGVTMEEYGELKEKAGAKGEVTWLKLDPQRSKNLGVPNPETIATMIREMLKEAGL